MTRGPEEKERFRPGVSKPHIFVSWASNKPIDTKISVHIYGRPNKVRGSAPPKTRLKCNFWAPMQWTDIFVSWARTALLGACYTPHTTHHERSLDKATPSNKR